MGVYIRKMADMFEAIESIPAEGRLFAFFLIDNRPSNEKYFRILETNKYWIDELSASSRIFTMMPFSTWTQLANPPGFMQMEKGLSSEEWDFQSTLERKEYNLNLSLSIASKFGVKPTDLPGILFFRQFPNSTIMEDSVLIKINEEDIIQLKNFEKKLSDLYALIQELWESEKTPQSILSQLRATLKSQTDIIPLPSVNNSIESLLNEVAEVSKAEEKLIDNYKYLSEEEKRGVQIFISYAREDQEFAELLYSRLKDAGFKPWLDTYSLVPGELWEKAIERALKNSMFFIACLSKQSVAKRGFLQKEFRFAIEKRKELLDYDIYLIPIKIDNCEVPSELGIFHWIDFNRQSATNSVRGTGWHGIMKSLTHGVRRRKINL